MRSARQRRAGAEGASARADNPRISLYDEVTRRIIAEMEAGRLPWVQPWGGAQPGLPRNAITGRNYSGVNILLLWGALIEAGYASQCWITFKQALAAGGCVRKGERGTTIVYADRFVPEAERERAERDSENAISVHFLKRFTLFNVAQCDGLHGAFAPDPVTLPAREIIPAAEALIKASGADFRIGGARAYYAPSADYIQVPPQQAFFHQIDFYRTALHELTHWVGHPARLARDLSGAFGSDKYAREELTAEMGSAFLCATLGIVPTVRHSDYLATWLDVLRNDNRAIFRAASAASKAADYLLAFHESSSGPGHKPAEPIGQPVLALEDRP